MPPDGVAIDPGYCWRLKWSFCGLKQAGRTLNKTLNQKLTGLGLNRLDSETCLYIFCDNKGQLCFPVVYVDDLLLAATSRTFMDGVKCKLTVQFKMQDLREASYILGITREWHGSTPRCGQLNPHPYPPSTRTCAPTGVGIDTGYHGYLGNGRDTDPCKDL